MSRAPSSFECVTKLLFRAAAVSCLLAIPAGLEFRADDSEYALGPDSMVKPDIPKGKIIEATWTESKVFPGTSRHFSIYVPAQYDGKKPAALMVFQDGHAYVNPKGEFRATTVMDNLIAEGSMPVTIGVFIDPGSERGLREQRGWKPTPSNRSFEYDTLSDSYASFLTDEIIPHLEEQFKITDNPELRAICGISSGGICAWTVAWERPDAFRKVLSHVGSFTNIRGGHQYPAMIRKTEKKPIRVFLQDGENDLNNRHGNWVLGNRQMASSLEFMEYDFQFVMGSGGHNGIHGGAILPESMRWLWRGWQDEQP